MPLCLFYKKMKRTILIIALLTTFGMSGCKDYFDLNENPNQISNPPFTVAVGDDDAENGP